MRIQPTGLWSSSVIRMGCNCSGNKREFEHTAPDGTKTVVKTQHEAIALARKLGGVWKIKE